jgi:hypothetical protein
VPGRRRAERAGTRIPPARSTRRRSGRASSVVLSRKYSEMDLENLSGVRSALDEL